MSLRLRLIVVFFLLSVVPLAAVTYYSYTSNVRAVRDAAMRESDLLAGELSQRMQLVTAQLSERVEHLMDLQSMQASTAAARQTPAKPASTKPAPTKPAAAPTAPPPAAAPPAAPPNMDQVYEAKVAQALGEAAMLLNNVELRGLNPRGDPGRQGRPPSGGRGPGQSTTVPPPGMPPPLPTSPAGRHTAGERRRGATDRRQRRATRGQRRTRPAAAEPARRRGRPRRERERSG